MKNLPKLLLGSLVLFGLQLGISSCATDGYVSESVYYGPHRDPWFRDDPWMDGHRWYGEDRGGGVGVYIHPPRYRR